MKQLYGAPLVLFLLLGSPAWANSATEQSASTSAATTDEFDDAPVTVNDPYQTFNRHAFALNQTLDKVIFKPVASVYRAITPWPLRKGVTNFFHNLHEIPSFANAVLEFHFTSAMTAAWRFAINSTAGILGLVDVASYMGLERDPRDFGMTLAHWGNKESPYLVLPIFGPSTVRDALGIPVDYYLSLYPHLASKRLRYSLITLNIINQRANLLQVENVVDVVAFDRYVFERDAYLQNRHARIEGELHADDNPPQSVHEEGLSLG